MANTAIEKSKGNQIETKEWFLAKVQDVAKKGANLELTPSQQALVFNYFIGIDDALKTAGVSWGQVANGTEVAQRVYSLARTGLDILQNAQVYCVPRRHKGSDNYTVSMQLGYNGKRLKAMKYALNQPKDEIVELVYSKDKFIPHMKSASNKIESYDFEITSPFDRGEIVGGFGYLIYDDPEKNKLILMSKDDMDKRKNMAQSNSFWGKWGKEMYYKTLVHEVYSEKYLPIDSRKIDEDFRTLQMMEAESDRMDAKEEIQQNANKETVTFDAEYTVNDTPDETEEPKQPEPIPQPEPEAPEAIDAPDWF